MDGGHRGWWSRSHRNLYARLGTGGRNTREKILELTIAVIDEGGEQAVRTNQLATDAGTTPPTLYHYFGSREGLIEQAQAERFLRSLIDDANYFVDRVAVIETGDELRAVLGEIFSRRDGAERENVRRRRLNAIGAAYARDGLSRRIAEVHNSIVSEATSMSRPGNAR